MSMDVQQTPSGTGGNLHKVFENLLWNTALWSNLMTCEWSHVRTRQEKGPDNGQRVSGWVSVLLHVRPTFSYRSERLSQISHQGHQQSTTTHSIPCPHTCSHTVHTICDILYRHVVTVLALQQKGHWFDTQWYCSWWLMYGLRVLDMHTKVWSLVCLYMWPCDWLVQGVSCPRLLTATVNEFNEYRRKWTAEFEIDVCIFGLSLNRTTVLLDLKVNGWLWTT